MIATWLNTAYGYCEVDVSEFCDFFSSVFTFDLEADMSLWITLFGGLDVSINADGQVSECVGDSWNAVGVCMSIEMNSVLIND